MVPAVCLLLENKIYSINRFACVCASVTFGYMAKTKVGKAYQKVKRKYKSAIGKINKVGKQKWRNLKEDKLLTEGFSVDKELSGKDWNTYYNPTTGKAIIRYRETDPKNLKDLGTDALIALGIQGVGSRFKRAEKVYDKAAKKYGGKDNVDVTGHSLGGSLALHVNQTRGAKATAFNPGAGPLEPIKNLGNKLLAKLGNRKAKRRIKNQKEKAEIIRNIGDPISLFSAYGGGEYKKHIKLPGNVNAHGQAAL